MSRRLVRWTCPTATHPAVLGSTRPRLDDVCRYCLECSRETGRLVQRVAPRLVKARLERNARRYEKRIRAIKRSQERTEAYYTVAGVNLLEEMRRMIKAKAFSAIRRVGRLPKLVVARASRKPGTFGRAYTNRWTVRIVDYPGITAVDVKETLCHELAHMATPGAGHGVRWKTVFRLAAEELLGVRPRVELRYHGEVTKMLKAAAESGGAT
jgi:hypothetical protein